MIAGIGAGTIDAGTAAMGAAAFLSSADFLGRGILNAVVMERVE